MATIRKYQGKGGISWQVRIRKKGKLLNGSFPSKRLAEDWARKIEHDIVQDTYLPEQKKPTTHAVHDLIALYLERLMPQKDPTTQRCQTPMLKWWDSVLADIPINHVTVALLEDYKYLLLNQKQFKPSTVNLYLNTLSPVFSWAASPRLNWLQTNPFVQVKRLREKARLPVLSDEQLEMLRFQCQQSQSLHLSLFVRLALATGGRHQELLNLMWSDINLQRKTVTFTDTKNDEDRVVPLDTGTVDILHYHFKTTFTEENCHTTFPSNTYLFQNPSTRKPILTMFAAFSKARQRAGLDWLHVHDLRHIYASRMAEKGGADLAALAELLGHRSLKVTMRYRHLTPKHHAALVEKMAAATF